MNYEKLSQLHFQLNEEFRKPMLNHIRIADLQYEMSQEYLRAKDQPAQPKQSIWDWIRLPPDWKIHATALLGAFIAFNSQLPIVPQNVQDAILAVAISLGFWAVNKTQQDNQKKLEAKFAAFAAAPVLLTSKPPEKKEGQ